MKRPRAFSLAVRLVATYAVIVAATLSVVGALVIDRTRFYLDRAIDARLTAAVKSFQNGPAAGADSPGQLSQLSRRWVDGLTLSEDSVAAIGVVNGDQVSSTLEGQALLRNVKGGIELLEYRSERWRWWTLGSGAGSVRALTVPLNVNGEQIGTLVVASSRANAANTISALTTGISRASVIGLVVAMALGFVGVRFMLRPLVGMIKEVEAIQATGDLSRRVSRGGPRDEVGRLAEAFDRMLGRLEEAFRSQQRFLSDASHELRTPLTVARGRLELLQRELREAESKRLAASTMEELDRMGRIVEELLLLARLDEGVRLLSERVEVDLVMREALLRAMQLGRREAMVDVEPGLFVVADPDRLLQVLSNLVGNAVHHAGEDATITLRARTRGNEVQLNVADNGKGIPPDELPHVFDRLYRGSQARTGAPGGAGLGLAIAASLVRAMGGEIDVQSTPGKGTTFSIRLPQAEAESRSLTPRGTA
jgi:two-component system OmpR family sensor kinase